MKETEKLVVLELTPGQLSNLSYFLSKVTAEGRSEVIELVKLYNIVDLTIKQESDLQNVNTSVSN